MAETTRVASVEEIPDGTAKVVDLKGKRIAVFNCGGKFYATTNTCPHRGGPVGEGEVEGTVITCPWHGWDFDITSGKCGLNPAAALTCYPTEVRGDDIWVEG